MAGDGSGHAGPIRLVPAPRLRHLHLGQRGPAASAYGRKLRNALSETGFKCFLDQEQTEGGVELTPALRQVLGRSRLLVVLAEPNVIDSETEASWIAVSSDGATIATATRLRRDDGKGVGGVVCLWDMSSGCLKYRVDTTLIGDDGVLDAGLHVLDCHRRGGQHPHDVSVTTR